MKIIWAFLILISTSVSIVFASQTDSIDFYYDVPEDLMQDRLKCLEKTIPLHYHDRVSSFINYFTVRNREYTAKVIAKKSMYFPIFEEILAKHDMPDELKYLSIIESGLNPNAMSRVGAGGLWQFMPSTGLSMGLSQSWYIDERMNPWKSTEAACVYLKQLYFMFGDWELALAAYNTGPGNVRKAIRRSGYKKTFWEIFNYLPRETRSYVPQFVAMIYSINYAEEHGFDYNRMDIQYHHLYDTVWLSDYVHIETLSHQLNICLEDVLKLNPQIIRGAIPEGTKNYALKMPEEVVELFRANRVSILDSASKVGKKELEYLAKNIPGAVYGRTRIIYQVRSGDVLGSIADRHHVRVEDLKKWNNLNSSMIRIGQKLNVWVLPTYNGSTNSSYVAQKPSSTGDSNKSDEASNQIVDTTSGQVHLVKSGESLWSIAEQYKNVSIETIKKLNNLRSSRIAPGQKLLISM